MEGVVLCCSRHLSSCYIGYFWEPHWFSTALPEISRVTWQVYNTFMCFIILPCLAHLNTPVKVTKPAHLERSYITWLNFIWKEQRKMFLTQSSHEMTILAFLYSLHGAFSTLLAGHTHKFSFAITQLTYRWTTYHFTVHTSTVHWFIISYMHMGETKSNFTESQYDCRVGLGMLIIFSGCVCSKIRDILRIMRIVLWRLWCQKHLRIYGVGK